MAYTVLACLPTALIGAGSGAMLALDRPVSGAVIGGLTGLGLRMASLLLSEALTLR